MKRKKTILKVDPAGDDPAEQQFDLDYYGAMTTAERFRLIIDRSVLLYRLAEKHAADRDSPGVVKRS